MVLYFYYIHILDIGVPEQSLMLYLELLHYINRPRPPGPYIRSCSDGLDLITSLCYMLVSSTSCHTTNDFIWAFKSLWTMAVFSNLGT